MDEFLSQPWTVGDELIGIPVAIGCAVVWYGLRWALGYSE